MPASSHPEAPISGSLLVLFLFDVCDEIRLDQLRKLLGSPSPGREPSFRQPAPEYVQFEQPPVIESLSPLSLPDGGSLGGRIAYYQYGVVSIQMEIPFHGGWDDLVALSARWMNAPEVEQRAAATVAEHLERAATALINPYSQRLTEDYYIFSLRGIPEGAEACLTARELIEHHGESIAQVVRGESAKFSPTECAEILGSQMSYYENDLLVVGWSAALVYDSPEGAAPTIRLLEYANTQLLEFRHYDAVLTGLLSQVYRTLDRRGGFLARWRLAREADRLNTIRLDIRELTERVDNSLKFLSDMFAARLYRMAAARIGVPDYRTLVDEKLQSAGELYGVMMDRFYQGRAFVLELMVVIILVIELVFLFRGIK